MSASERETHPRQPSLPQQSVLSMRDLLASCAAASAVSTPPREKRLDRLDEEQEPAARRDAA
ncbi:hypothetical protein OG883_02365 [Streptomyces sp. NBC_01142]|uniref:hypothetical protein n=1 Tax=Streptomyces sp. NBC_01142 TaxID=2975865 RepID=UPI002254609C|nr:hypothetical protein [Streptomyces sp. NBC_01142]MCX4818762.1 hypothetical protein [Streptomyces sp. NBC_01142]